MFKVHTVKFWSSNMGVRWNLVALVVVFSHFTLADEFLKNEYVYSVERDWMLQQEKEYSDNRLALTEDEVTVNQYLSYLKSEEFQRTKPAVPPSRPLEETLNDILHNSTLYQALKKLPKGGNMHIHENHMLSRKLLLDIVFDSEDFEHLWIIEENAPKEYRLDFFLNPPDNQSYVKVQNSSYTKERILEKQTLLGVMDDKAKKYPTDSDTRWRQMDQLWDRGSYQIINNIKIKREYIKAMLNTSLEEGVQYLENRIALDGALYVLDPDPKYASSNGKRLLDNNTDTELNLTISVIEEFIRDNPDFIGMKRIIYSVRSFTTNTDIKQAIQNVLPFHRKYPTWVVGYDLVAEEDAGKSHLFFLESFLTLYDDATKRKKMDLFLHTAETSFPGDQKMSRYANDPVSALKNSYDAIMLGAKRVGHGLGFIKHPYLMKVLKDKKIAVETCPVSNQLLGLQADLRNHPAQTYLRYGIPVVLGSDDPGSFGYDYVTVDWYMAYFGWGLDLADLKLLAQNALEYSAMTVDEKKSAVMKFESLWNRYINETRSQACSSSFSGTPAFAKVLPQEGARSGSTKVYIYGSNFQKGICKPVKCKFGNQPARQTQLVSPELIICESPPLAGSRRRRSTENGQTFSLQVSFDGTTYVETNHNFTYMYDRYVHPTVQTTLVPTLSSGASFITLNIVLSLLCFGKYLL